MFDIFRISFFEYKKIFSKLSSYISIGLVFLLSLMSVEQMLKYGAANNSADTQPLTNNSVDIQSLMNNPLLLINLAFVSIMQFIIIFQAVGMLVEEFRCGTVPFIFTSTKSRTQILLSKILSFGLFGITIGFLNFILVMYYQSVKGINIQYELLGFTLLLYFIYSWFIGNYFMFFTVVFKSRTTSFITGLFFLYFLGDNLSMLVRKLHISNGIFDFVPFYNVFSFLLGASINENKIIGMLVGGVVFFILSAFIFEKQDLS